MRHLLLSLSELSNCVLSSGFYFYPLSSIITSMLIIHAADIKLPPPLSLL